MAYLRRWRECHSAVLAIGRTSQATISSDDNDSADNNNVQHSEQHEPSETSVNSIDSSEMSDNGLNEAVSSSDSESSGNEHEVVIEKDLEGELREWSVESQISKSSLDKLLTILRKNGHQGLPKDSRTLLHTPREVPVYDKCGGKYVYLGIKESLEKRVQTDAGKFSSQLNLTFNIDGVPVFKSSNTQFWPILCLLQNCKPFIVALFYGSSKPSNVSEFLDDFTNEASELNNSGIRIGDVVYSVNIRAFVCDAPARAFVKNIKSHTGYYSCERCEIKGYWKENRVVFHSNCQFQKRHDDQFSNYCYNLHQTGETPLINCGVSCVQDFPLDYMHLVCLGVVKRLLCFLKQGPPCCKLSSNLLSQASDKLMDLSGKLPSEFARQPRSLTFMDRWKATEFRQFLLYTGPVVLKKILSKEKYTHFLTFTVGISILLESDAATRNGYLDYAEQLLCFFVDTCKEHYSEKFVVYNVHNLKHITDDSRYFGCSLNDISSFPFENYLKTVKGLVRNSRNPISQVAKRLKESEVNHDFFTEKSDFNYISTKQRNSCFLLYDESFVFIKEKQEDGNFVCNIVPQEQTDDIFSAPCSSKLLNIVFLRKTRRMKRKVVAKSSLYKKVVCLPYEDGYVLIPMLHGVER